LHPLFGQELEPISERRNWGDDRLYFSHASGRLTSIPVAFTDLAAPDPFVATAAGRSYFRVQELLQLVRFD